MTNYKRPFDKERGNVLFLILIAVALFAALSYAVTQSGRTSGSVEKETAQVSAGLVTQHPAVIRTAISRMMLSGTPVNVISFAVPTGSSTQVFDPAGGAAINPMPPDGIGTAAGGTAADGFDGATARTWGYKDALAVNLGYYITGVGTDTNDTGRDVLAFLKDISLPVCQQINKGLFGSSVIPAQANAVDYTTAGGKGEATFGTATSNTFSANPGQAFSCIRNGATLYDYYHALVEQ